MNFNHTSKGLCRSEQHNTELRKHTSVSLAALEITVPMLAQSKNKQPRFGLTPSHRNTSNNRLNYNNPKKQFIITRTMIYNCHNKQCTIYIYIHIYIKQHQHWIYSIGKVVIFLSPSSAVAAARIQYVIPSIHMAIHSYNNPLMCSNE